jgi:hypothetical protein
MDQKAKPKGTCGLSYASQVPLQSVSFLKPDENGIASSF